MKHYCNRRQPRQYPAQEKQNSEVIPEQQSQTSNLTDYNYTEENSDDVIFPPGYDGGVIYEPTPYNPTPSPDMQAQGGALSQGSGYSREFTELSRINTPVQSNSGIFYDNMSGKFGLMSISQNNDNSSAVSMPGYLDRYVGKYICLDLWTADCRREEMCGILTEIGRNFLVIHMQDTNNLAMVDLNTVRYISIFCR